MEAGAAITGKRPCAYRYSTGDLCGERQHHSVHSPGADHDYVDAKQAGLQPMSAGMRRYREESGYNEAVQEVRGWPCEIKSPVCSGAAEHIHEVLPRGRAGGLRAAVESGAGLLATCDNCNQYVSEHPLWSEMRGFLKHWRPTDD